MRNRGCPATVSGFLRQPETFVLAISRTVECPPREMEFHMSEQVAASTPQVAPIRISNGVWTVFAFAILGLFMITLDNGQLLQSSASSVHEFMHDGRHLLGVPCH